jgi:hypothetical protein
MIGTQAMGEQNRDLSANRSRKNQKIRQESSIKPQATGKEMKNVQF